MFEFPESGLRFAQEYWPARAKLAWEYGGYFSPAGVVPHTAGLLSARLY
jgi:hypothetical protein